MPAADGNTSSDSLTDSSDDDSALSPPPSLDGGWGWVVVAGSFFAHLIADGCSFSFGVLYVELLSHFGETRSKTAWVGSLFVSVPLLAGPVAGVATDRFGCRRVAIVGGMLAAAGFVVSAFATSIEMLCVTFGIISGFALSLVYVPAVVVVAHYFEKQRAFATGIAVAGSGIGTFVLAPLTETLINEYGWRGAVLILAGLMFNLVLCGSLFRPLTKQRHRRRCMLTNTTSVDTTEMPPDGDTTHFHEAVEPTSHSLGQIPRYCTQYVRSEKPARQTGRENTLWVRQTMPATLERRDVVYRGRLLAGAFSSGQGSTRWASCPNIDVTVPVVPVPQRSCCQRYADTVVTALRWAVRKVTDVCIMGSRTFAVFCLSNALLYGAYDVPYVYTPDAATKRGVDVTSASLLVAVIGIASTVGQVLIGYVGDHPRVHTLHLYNALTAFAGFATAAVPAIPRGFAPFAVYCAVFGFTISANYALTTIILVDLLGMDRLTNAYGIVMLAQGVANMLGPPLAGWISDVTGSYDMTFIIAGCVITLSGVMLFIMPCIQRYDDIKPRSDEDDEPSSSSSQDAKTATRTGNETCLKNGSRLANGERTRKQMANGNKWQTNSETQSADGSHAADMLIITELETVA